MRFRRLKIENFRGIRSLTLEDLRDVVVVAGPNGSGKTAILDAIRLLKSFYGGYQENEWQQWMGEFKIDPSRPEDLQKLFGNPSQDLMVEADIELSQDELSQLVNNAEELLRPIIWRRILGRRMASGYVSGNDIQQYGPRVASAITEQAAQLRSAITGNSYRAHFKIPAGGELSVGDGVVLATAFQVYEPDIIGVIDYHSSSRNYPRETLGGISLNLDQVTEQRKNQLLYNSQAKYQNIKTELAGQYIREVIAKRAGVTTDSDLNSTLSELFQTFFPDKSYEGISAHPDGSITFPVKLATGEVHDIDDLSSGEKELLYGYLRLRDTAPRNSVILIDEPELHLNPRLLQGFPDFYHAHIGRAYNNQIWLVTHSDTLLRQAVGKVNFSVYHMSPKTVTTDGDNQASAVLAGDDVENAVIAMVGDLAAYRPRAKVVIFEGGGGSDIDVAIVSRLFPLAAQRMNFVSGGQKLRVRDLYSILSETATKAQLTERFYAIVDRDRIAEDQLPAGENIRQWDRYHIENYLLDESAILAALTSMLGRSPLADEEAVTRALRECAGSLVDRLILERLQGEINDGLIREIKIRANPSTSNPSRDLKPSIDASLKRLTEMGKVYGSDQWLTELESRHRSELQKALESDAWRSEFPGRRILTNFVERHVTGASYEIFRNVVIDKMAERGVEPEGLRSVICEIDAS